MLALRLFRRRRHTSSHRCPSPQLSPMQTPPHPTSKASRPRQRFRRQPQPGQTRQQPLLRPLLPRPAGLRAIRTPHRPLRPCLHAAWSCPRLAHAPSTRRPNWFQPPKSQGPATRPLAQAFNAASLSSTATGHRAVRAAIRSALPAAHSPQAANSQAARAQSILRAPLQAATPAPALPALPALPRVLALERPVRAASAALPVPAALRLQPARPRVRRAPHPEAEAAVPSNIPRPKKAR